MRPNTDTIKILRKVRRQYLHKSPDEDEEQAMVPLEVDPDTRSLGNTNGYTIKASVGLVEIGRKVLIGPEHFKLSYNIKSIIVENERQNKAVALYFSPKEDRSGFPWEYTAKRLESYGDLQLATWGHRIKKHYNEYGKALENIHNLLTSNNPETQASMNRLKMRVAETRKEIESKYAYNRYIQFFGKDRDTLISTSFTETFLNQLGFTAESFMKWSKENGVPRVLPSSSYFYEKIIKLFLTSIQNISEPIEEITESKDFIYTKDGSKRKVTLRSVNIVDPTPEGAFFYCYIIICDNLDKDFGSLSLQYDEGQDAEAPKKKRIPGEDNAEENLEEGDHFI